MGMHIGMVAAKTSVRTLRDAFLRAWPTFELVAAAEKFSEADAMWRWKQDNEEFVSAADWRQDNPGKSVYMFWQDGEWALLFDPSYTVASAEKELAHLSKELSSVLSFVVETAGGCALFWCFDNGNLRRHIRYTDGEVVLVGEPLAEETGIDVNQYYMAETEMLWKAYGMSPYDRFSSPIGCQAISVIDHTDYSSL
jgi:hypothetical protein